MQGHTRARVVSGHAMLQVYKLEPRSPGQGPSQDEAPASHASRRHGPAVEATRAWDGMCLALEGWAPFERQAFLFHFVD